MIHVNKCETWLVVNISTELLKIQFGMWRGAGGGVRHLNYEQAVTASGSNLTK